MQLLVIQFTITMFQIDFNDYNENLALWNIVIVNCITNSCIWNTCVTWQGIDYKLPEDDTIVSKHVEVWSFVN
jgi:hypothetical protein